MARSSRQFIFILLCLVYLIQALDHSSSCFCKLQGEVDDCSCKVESVDSFNNLKVFPRLNSLLQKDYFRYWKVNLHKECPFWPDDSGCALKSCAINQCSEDELPAGLKPNNSNKKSKDAKVSTQKNGQANPAAKYTEHHSDEDCGDEDKELGSLNTMLSDATKEALESWRIHDDAQDNFCEFDDDFSNQASYVDLLLNPERYTGYKGASPRRIWNSIYKENCFYPEKKDFRSIMSNKPDTQDSSGSMVEEMCLEKRVFFRLISGLHTSINIHLSAHHFYPDKFGMGPGKWAPNIEEFKSRFNAETTNGMGPQFLKNLYFTYLVELRALVKAAPILEQEEFYTGIEADDIEVRAAVKDILDVARSFPEHFDESKLFQGNKKEAMKLKEEFKQHFRNISRIMDCVGCDKCKLWGKLQVTGMGTALKILFSGDTVGLDSTVTNHMKKPFQLVRTEIVALLNAFGRLSRSIHEVEQFRRMIS